MSSFHDAFEQVENALDEENIVLARRYLSKIKEQVFCASCHEPVYFAQLNAHDWYKGVRHDDCDKP
jgi:hypothetical protein